MKYKSVSSILFMTILVLLVMMSAGVLAQDDMEGDMQAVTITATEEGIIVAEIISAGLTEITFENSTDIPFYSIIARLDDGASMDDFMESLMGVFAGDPSAVPPANFLGSPLALPGETQAALYNLEAGMYIVLSVAGEQPDIATFLVEGDMTEEITIEPDLTVQLADFVFGLPDELMTGEQIWQIDNVGDQWHEMVFMSIPEGSTIEDAMMMLMPPETEESDEGENDGEEGEPSMDGISFLWSPMSNGNSGFTKIDLAPGTYLVICFIPDSTSEEGLSHAEQGMLRIVNVLETDE